MHCVNCAGIFHANCVNLEKNELHARLLWYYPCWVPSIFPYNHIDGYGEDDDDNDDDDEFYSVTIEGALGYSNQL